MEREFWLERWQKREIGFHEPEGQPWLHAHWSRLGLAAGSRVCVPLCGKSRDMDWLAAHGHQVTGIELSAQAARDFFTEAGRDYRVEAGAGLPRYHHQNIEILVGDLFDLPATLFAAFDACYDRAALIALPPAMRRRYVEHLYGHLPAGAQALLIALSYEPRSMAGPPFSVAAGQVRQLLAPHAEVLEIARQPLPAQAPLAQRGAQGLENTLYQLRMHQR